MKTSRRRAAGADAAVPPDRGRTGGGEQRDRHGRARAHELRRTSASLPLRAPRRRRSRRRQAEQHEHDATSRQAPGADSHGSSAEAAGERADDRAGGVRRVGEADCRGRRRRGPRPKSAISSGN